MTLWKIRPAKLPLGKFLITIPISWKYSTSWKCRLHVFISLKGIGIFY